MVDMEICRRREARRLKNSFTQEQVREMGKVANLYFDLRQTTPSKSSSEVLHIALHKYGKKLVDKCVYFTRGKGSHVSELRLEAAKAIVSGEYGGLDAVVHLGRGNVHVPRDGQRTLQEIVPEQSEMPDYPLGYPMIGGFRKE